jgi:hypothetical protein
LRETRVFKIDDEGLDWRIVGDSCVWCSFDCPLFSNELIQRRCIRESIDKEYFGISVMDEENFGCFNDEGKSGLVIVERFRLID